MRLSARSAGSWRTDTLADWEDDLALPTCGLTCKVGDLYRGTPLARSRQTE